MAKHKVVKGFKGSPDGFTVIEFNEGDPFEHGGELLKTALEEKWVVPVKQAPAEKTPEQLKEAAKNEVEKLSKALEKASAANKPKVQAKLDAAKTALDALN